jgi:hypothetical protein
MDEQHKPAVIIVFFAPEVAPAFARFLQQQCEDDYKRHARDQLETYRMLVGGEAMLDALVRAGFAPH